MQKFNKEERSTFSYWFAHWCAFQMVALNLHIWKFKYLFHDIEKPWLRLFMDYEKVQSIHRFKSKHHLEWLYCHGLSKLDKIDIDALIIDNECSRFTKETSPFTAREYCNKMREKFKNALSEDPYNAYYQTMIHAYNLILNRITELNL